MATPMQPSGRSAKPILCVGALTADLMMQVPALPTTSGKVLASRAAFVAAGMATSAATAVARLGHPVALWATAGRDMLGDFVLAEIARDGIDIGLVRRPDGVMTATATIIVDDAGERVVIPYYADGITSRPETVPDFSAFGAVLVDVRWPEAAAVALDGARDAGIPAILDLDVGPKDALARLAPLATHVVASSAGAATLTGETDPERALVGLSRYADADIVVTLGESGSIWRDAKGGRVHRQPAFAVRAVDTNAAGDVFHGTFAVGIAEGRTLIDAIRFASAAAAIKCTRYGGRTGAPTRAEVAAFLDRHEIQNDEAKSCISA